MSVGPSSNWPPAIIRRAMLHEAAADRVRVHRPPDVQLSAVPIEQTPDLDARLADLPKTDLGNAERLVARFGADVRYCPAWKSWLIWDGRRYAVDETGEINQIAGRVVRAMLYEAAAVADANDRKALAAWQRMSESRARMESMVKVASSLEGIPVKHDDLDRDGWLLNCINGVVDLKTGTLRPHDRADLMTQLCPVRFDPSASCPLWDSTLDLFFAGDAKLTAYWQRLCGYFLTGVVREHVLPIAYGSGANGKSTILGTMLRVMGSDYAMKAPPSMLVLTHNEGHPTVLADLFRKRLAVALELAETHALNEALVKELTGGDSIRARRLYQDHWEFDPTHTVVIGTNHLPTIRGQDNGIWRRTRLIPFTVSLPPEDQDTTVRDRLDAELPGVLAWAVRGCLAWQTVGLSEPESVKAATAEYRSGQDTMGAFLESAVILDPSVRDKASKLYEAYRSWATAAGETHVTARKFGEALTDRGIQRIRNNGIWYVGIAVKDD